MGMLDGKVALIMGAAAKDNMAQAIARAYAKEGAKVVVTGRHESVLKELAEEIGGAWTLCDFLDKSQIEAAAAFTKQRFGRLDISVNGVAKSLIKPFEENTDEDIQGMLDLLFKAPFKWLQVMVKAMDKGGSIINLSSAVATVMFEQHQAYMGAKAGMNHVVRAVANEYGVKGIRVNTIAPGMTVTPMAGGVAQTPGFLEAFASGYPLGRIGTIADIAFAAVFLASDRCFMTGEVLQVNGGLTLRRNPSLAEIQQSMMQAGQSVSTTELIEQAGRNAETRVKK